MPSEKPETNEKTNLYLNDHWTLDVALLGYKDFCCKIQSIVKDCTPPFSVAICGGWGSGKTSILRYVMAGNGGKVQQLHPEEIFIKKPTVAELPQSLQEKWDALSPDKKDCFPSVWFNLWQHQFEPNPLKALLHEIYSQLSLQARMVKEAHKIANVVLNSGLKLLADLIGTTPSHIMKAGEAYEKKNYLDASDSQRFPLFFEQAVKQIASGFSGSDEVSETARLVIFIDDLDRCQPEKAYKLLESIKLYLNTPHCVFVFGIDYHCLIDELANLKEFGRTKHDSKDYLDKMFQVLVKIPKPTDEHYQKFIVYHTENMQKIGKPEQNMLSSILERNPRKTKNFLNSLNHQLELQPDQEKNPPPTQILLIHYLRIFYPDVYTVLEAHPEKAFPALIGALSGEPYPEEAGLYAFFLEEMKNELMDNFLDSSNESSSSLKQVDDKMLLNMKRHTATYKVRSAFKTCFLSEFNHTIIYRDLF